MTIGTVEWRLSASAFLEAVDVWKQTYRTDYCQTKCTGTCCDLSKKFLILDLFELTILAGANVCSEEYRLDEPGIYRYGRGVCPQYDPNSRQCKIHEHPNRPLGCKDYPLYIENLNQKGHLWVGVAKYCHLKPSDEEFRVLSRIGETFGIPINKL